MVINLYLTAHLSIGSSTGAATSGLNTKQVIEEGTNEVVVQKHSTGRVADQEWEYGQSWHGMGTDHHQFIDWFPFPEHMSAELFLTSHDPLGTNSLF